MLYDATQRSEVIRSSKQNAGNPDYIIIMMMIIIIIIIQFGKTAEKYITADNTAILAIILLIHRAMR